MGQIFAGLTFTAACLALGIAMMRKHKAPRIAAIIMFLAGCGLVGTWWQGFASNLAAMVPPAILIFAAIFCAAVFFMDCWGKQNKAGKATAIIGFFVPMLLIVMPMSLFGINPDEFITGVRDAGVQTMNVGSR